MSEIEVKAKAGEEGTEHVILYDFGADLEDMVDKFGSDVVFSNARANMKIGLQAAMRRKIKQGEDVDVLTDAYKPGVAMERSFDALGATKRKFKDMTPEERAAYIAELEAIDD